ncbi:hypothetical protein [Scytonema sp. UIC 10036]|nr:hypothetical protein [Scytonema sp. UIC 10036]
MEKYMDTGTENDYSKNLCRSLQLIREIYNEAIKSREPVVVSGRC